MQEPNQPQWQPVTRPLTRAEWGAMFSPLWHIITSMRFLPRDMWTSMVDTTRDARAFLRQPPRWFLIATAIFTVLALAFCSISLRNHFVYYAH